MTLEEKLKFLLDTLTLLDHPWRDSLISQTTVRYVLEKLPAEFEERLKVLDEDKSCSPGSQEVPK